MWLQVLSSNFRKSSDLPLSAKENVSDCTKLFPLYFQVKPFWLGLFTDVGADIFYDIQWVEDMIIDSTFKTNQKKMELFCVMVSCFGTGFLLAYFMLEPSTSGAYRKREEFLTDFLCKVEKNPSLTPSFFFTDEKTSQIRAIWRSFYVQPSLCLWHLIRAINKKIIQAPEFCVSTLSSTNKTRSFWFYIQAILF